MAFAILLLSLIVVTGAVTYVLTYKTPVDNHTHGSGNSISLCESVDPQLKPYLNFTSGSSGYADSKSAWEVRNGTVTWIGQPQDPIQSLDNIHLVMYTRVDNSYYVGNATRPTFEIGCHLGAYQTEPTLPSDIIDHAEVIIPHIGAADSQYQFCLNCSTFIPNG